MCEGSHNLDSISQDEVMIAVTEMAETVESGLFLFQVSQFDDGGTDGDGRLAGGGVKSSDRQVGRPDPSSLSGQSGGFTTSH